MSEKWTPATWRSRPIEQAPDYPDLDALAAVEARLATYPPLVFAGEARKLKAKLADVAHGRLSCCRAAIAPRASPSTAPTTSAISSASSCRWPWC